MTKDHPFVRPKRPSLRPDLAPARALRAGVVEDAACGTGEAGAKRPRRPRAQRYAHQPGTPSPSTPDGITALPKCLIIGGESPPAITALSTRYRPRQRAPPRSGYRGSDLVHWHDSEAQIRTEPVRLLAFSGP